MVNIIHYSIILPQHVLYNFNLSWTTKDRMLTLILVIELNVRSAKCDPPQGNLAYCDGYQSEIQAKIVVYGDHYQFSFFGMDRQRNHSSTQ